METTTDPEQTCACGHIHAGHAGDGPCLVFCRRGEERRPAFLRNPCPCERFTPVPAMHDDLSGGYGWCTRCGTPYDRPTRPACECAGEPPTQWNGKRPPNFHPEQTAYLARVRSLRHVPTA